MDDRSTEIEPGEEQILNKTDDEQNEGEDEGTPLWLSKLMN